jgi:hypothetical protein
MHCMVAMAEATHGAIVFWPHQAGSSSQTTTNGLALMSSPQSTHLLAVEGLDTIARVRLDGVTAKQSTAMSKMFPRILATSCPKEGPLMFADSPRTSLSS